MLVTHSVPSVCLSGQPTKRDMVSGGMAALNATLTACHSSRALGNPPNVIPRASLWLFLSAPGAHQREWSAAG